MPTPADQPSTVNNTESAWTQEGEKGFVKASNSKDGAVLTIVNADTSYLNFPANSPTISIHLAKNQQGQYGIDFQRTAFKDVTDTIALLKTQPFQGAIFQAASEAGVALTQKDIEHITTNLQKITPEALKKHSNPQENIISDGPVADLLKPISGIHGPIDNITFHMEKSHSDNGNGYGVLGKKETTYTFGNPPLKAHLEFPNQPDGIKNDYLNSGVVTITSPQDPNKQIVIKFAEPGKGSIVARSDKAHPLTADDVKTYLNADNLQALARGIRSFSGFSQGAVFIEQQIKQMLPKQPASAVIHQQTSKDEPSKSKAQPPLPDVNRNVAITQAIKTPGA